MLSDALAPSSKRKARPELRGRESFPKRLIIEEKADDLESALEQFR